MRSSSSVRHGRRRTLLAAAFLVPFVLLFAVLFAFPLARTLSRSLLEPAPGFGNFAKALSDPLFRQVFWTTIRISVEVTVASAILGYPVASFAAECRPMARNLVFACVLVPFWTSLLVRVYGWTFILQRTGLINTVLGWLGLTDRPVKLLYNEGAVVLGITHYMVPFMIFSLYVAIRGMDARLKPAAATLGARPLRVFLTVTLPLIGPGLVSGGLLVFIGSIGFFVTPALLGSPSEMMIANLITFEVKEALDWPMACTLSLILAVAVLLLSWIYFRMLKGADRFSAGVA